MTELPEGAVRLRWPKIVAIVAAVVLGLAGCSSPPTSGWAAVHLSPDGELEVLLSLCEDEKPASLGVFVHGDDGKLQAWGILAPYPPVASSQREFTAFELPEGWSVYEDKLQRLVNGKSYGLEVTTSGYRRTATATGPRDTYLNFRLDQLHDLSNNQVLVSGPFGDGKVMSVEEFEDGARASCP